MNLMNALNNISAHSRFEKITDDPKDLQLWKEQSRLKTRDDMISLSKSARKALSEMRKNCAETDVADSGFDPRAFILRTIIASFVNKAIRNLRTDDLLQPKGDSGSDVAPWKVSGSEEAQSINAGLSVEAEYLYAEMKTVSFTMSGVVKTEDGREIKFDMDLNIEKALFIEKDITVETGDGDDSDQVTVNFSGTAAQLTNFSFEFDFEDEGVSENSSFAKQGWGHVRFGDRTNQSLQLSVESFILKSCTYACSYEDGNAGSIQHLSLAV